MFCGLDGWLLWRFRGDRGFMESMASWTPRFHENNEFYGSNGSGRCLFWCPSRSQETRCYDVSNILYFWVRRVCLLGSFPSQYTRLKSTKNVFFLETDTTRCGMHTNTSGTILAVIVQFSPDAFFAKKKLPTDKENFPR